MMKAIPILLSLLLPTFLHAGEAILSIDFESDAAGNQPAGAIHLNGNTGQIEVLEAVDLPNSPFSESSGKVLQLTKGADQEAMPRVTWAFEPLTRGTLTFKAATFFEGDYNDPLLNIFLLHDTLSLIGPNVFMTADQIHLRDNGAWRVFPHIWQPNTENEVRIEFYEDQTYRLLVNGKGVPDETTRFAYHMPETVAISRVQFAIASSTVFASRVFVDDIRVAPLP